MKPRFEGQPLIDAYGDNGFRLADQRFQGAILLTPSGLYPWPVGVLADATPASLAPIADAAPAIDFVIVGTGGAFAKLPREVVEFFRSIGRVPDLMDTGAACRTYNVLRAENRRVAAALIPIP
jgi:uncharacterized protein